jgi:hypothetical protein
MFSHTDTKQSPWYVVEADDKKRARLNCITHLLSLIPYKEIPYKKIEIPHRQDTADYIRPPKDTQTYVPSVY